jgi:hypothetical protein
MPGLDIRALAVLDDIYSLYVASFVDYLKNLFSLPRLYSFRWKTDSYMMNWKGFGRKGPCSNRGTISALAWRE